MAVAAACHVICSQRAWKDYCVHYCGWVDDTEMLAASCRWMCCIYFKSLAYCLFNIIGLWSHIS